MITITEPESGAAPVADAAVRPLTLTDISQLGYLRKTKEVFPGVVVSLQTVSISRQQKILVTLPADNIDPVIRFTHLQIETLANATLSINSESFTESDVERLRAFYAGLQSRVLQAFYAIYQEMMDEQEQSLISLKKT